MGPTNRGEAKLGGALPWKKQINEFNVREVHSHLQRVINALTKVHIYEFIKNKF